jgi:hypothetical protein
VHTIVSAMTYGHPPLKEEATEVFKLIRKFLSK